MKVLHLVPCNKSKHTEQLSNESNQNKGPGLVDLSASLHPPPDRSVPLLNPQGVWSGSAIVLGKLPVPGSAFYNLDDSRARAYCACSRCWCGLFGHFYSPLSFSSLLETAQYRLKYCLKGPLNQKQTTNQPLPPPYHVIWLLDVPRRHLFFRSSWLF